MEKNNLKTLNPVSCPHCQKEFYVEFSLTVPMIDNTITDDDVKKAKADLKKKVNELNLDAEKKLEIISWIDDPDVMFSEADTDRLYGDIKLQNNL